MPHLPARSALDAIKRVPWFAGVAEAALERLAAHSRGRTLAAGDAVSRRGQPQPLLSLIQSGSLELTIHGREGKRHVVRRLLPGDVFGLIPVLDGGSAVHDADAHEPTELLQIHRDVLLGELATQPALSIRLLQLFCSRSRQLYEILAFQQLLPLHARAAHLLMCLVDVEPQARPGAHRESEIHMTQSEMSDMLGVSRQSLNAELKKLESQRLIRLAHARIVVADPAGLKRLADAAI